MAKIEFQPGTEIADIGELSSQYRTLSFASIGQSWAVDMVTVVNYTVTGKKGTFLGQLLRLYSGQTIVKEDGELILTQALEKHYRPVIGRTAMLVPIGERLADAEERIALTLYQTRAPNQSAKRHELP